MDYLRNIGANKHQKGPPGGHNPPRRANSTWRALVGCGLLGPSPVPIFWYISHFDLEKNKEKAFEMERRCLEVELGKEHFCPLVERFGWGNFPPGGGNQSHHHHQQSSHLWEANIHQHLQQNHLLSNTSSSLVFNLCTRTLDWYLWVTSSVDYILKLIIIWFIWWKIICLDPLCYLITP